ncbi:MAG: fimbrillin family protein [Candidatus Cryptobacteroides sp.]
MKKLPYIIMCILLTACSYDLHLLSEPAAEQVVRFEVTVIDQPQTKGMVLDVYDNDITRDFKSGDSFGLFIIDANDEFVDLIDGKNAKNIKVTTPDGKAWNLNSDIKEVVHKLGYRYVAYYPYSEAFNDCSSTAGIENLLTAPDIDQSTQEATDWMYTDITAPQANAVTVLAFKHRYAKIEIYNSFTQDNSNDWSSAYKFTKTVDENGVERYRYILDAESPMTLSISGKYSIGNELTGMKEFSYNCNDIIIENGRHSIVYNYKVDERCAIDLGFPSGIRWSPINLGTETDTYMDEAAISSIGNVLGKRLAWGELFEKSTYSYDTYINDPYNSGTSLLPSDIAGTVYDPVSQYWGGHWTLPSADDLQEFIDNTELVGSEEVYSDELGKNINKLTFRSKINGKEITLLTNGYATNSSVVSNSYLYYMSSTRAAAAYCTELTNNPSMKTYNNYRYIGYSIRPVLKERYIYSYTDKKDIIVRHIDELAVDLGVTKTVTEVIDGVSQEVTYKLLWSPFNYGVEAKVDLQTYNGAPVDEDVFIEKCNANPGMRLAWGDTEEPAKFNKTDYNKSAIAQKYVWGSSSFTDTDVRDLLEEDDIVRLNWPEGWCLPTAKDFELLVANVTITSETINSRTWFRLTGANGNFIMIPATSYIDNAANTEKWGSDAYLQSSTIGTANNEPKQYALNLSGSTGKVVGTAGRATGLMVRPVKYVVVK